MTGNTKEVFISYTRSFIFGVEDSLVSTVGLLSGIAVADLPQSEIFLTGMVLLFVEAFSMGVGNFLSEHSVEKFETKDGHTSGRPAIAGIIMFFSYFLAGFIPLGPYIIWQVNIAFPASILSSLIALFTLGVISARIFRIKAKRNGFEMLVLGGGAILIGIVVGVILK